MSLLENIIHNIEHHIFENNCLEENIKWYNININIYIRRFQMASFANPFAGNVPRKLTKEELIQAIRLDIVGELEAIFVYDAHVQATDDPVAKRIISDIRDEEKAHIGELMTLLRHLDPQEAVHFAEGEEEVKEMLAELNLTQTSNTGETVGSLINNKEE